MKVQVRGMGVKSYCTLIFAACEVFPRKGSSVGLLTFADRSGLFRWECFLLYDVQ